MEKLETASERFLVVGLGASAGGLEAIIALLAAMPVAPGIAFLVVCHQPVERVSLLPEILARHCRLPVALAIEGEPLVVDRVYVAPPGGRLAVTGGLLSLSGREPHGDLPIDFCLRSLAAELKERVVAVVVSGTGSDGTLGSAAVKAAGGLVIAQEPGTAEHAGMPASIIAAGLADWVLAPAAIAARLLAHASELRADGQATGSAIGQAVLARLYTLLRERTGRDFSSYKASTIRRRIARRMVVRQVSTAEAYLKELEANVDEVDRLFKDLLIGVTSFFRDPDVWRSLAEQALAPLVASGAPGRPFRAWVAGCSTGEEAFTIAMLLSELSEHLRRRFDVQIFATDLDDAAIDVARAGLYPEAIVADVGHERLERFFIPDKGGYRVRQEIREQVIFAVHDLANDPSFSRLDLLSCRNVLIYMDAPLQERLLATFHYALRPGGVLLLGTSESLGRLGGYFEAVDGRLRVFRRLGGAGPPRVIGERVVAEGRRADVAAPSRGDAERGLGALVERRLVARYLPPAIVVDERGDLLHVHGRTGPYLEPAPGRPTHNALAMARAGLGLTLTAAVREALASAEPAVYRDVEVESDGRVLRVTVTAETLALPEGRGGAVLVTFEPGAPVAAADAAASPAGQLPRVLQLEHEMRRARDQLQTAIEELESSNEEQQSINEELQSANEELETSKEEMHSLNEELQTVNAELQLKVEMLSQVNDDMTNLLNSTEIATLFLDRRLHIKRFTRPARALFHLIDGDVGRPIQDLASTLVDQSLAEDGAQVLRTLIPREVEVADKSGRTYLMRILPYRTTDNLIDGLVVTFIDTTELTAAKALAASRALATGIVETVREPLLVLDQALAVVTANAAFYAAFACGAGEVLGARFLELDQGVWDMPTLRQRLTDVLERDVTFEGLAVERVFPRVGERRLLLNARRLVTGGAGASVMVLLAMEPVPRAEGGSTP